jgi:hypothetical protein
MLSSADQGVTQGHDSTFWVEEQKGSEKKLMAVTLTILHVPPWAGDSLDILNKWWLSWYKAPALLVRHPPFPLWS